MKIKYIFVIFLILGVSRINAQFLPGDEYKKTSKEIVESDAGKVYIGLAGHFANIIDVWGFDVGIRTGAMVSKNFAIGFNLFNLVTQNVLLPVNSNGKFSPYLRMTYGGIEIEYFLKLHKSLNISASALFELGNASYSESIGDNILVDNSGDWLFIGEPMLNFNIRVISNLWVSLNFGYRISAGVNEPLTNKELSGWVTGITLKSLAF